ncbi:MAG: glycoside hydrolase family 5 protein [Sphingobium sp.]
MSMRALKLASVAAMLVLPLCLANSAPNAKRPLGGVNLASGEFNSKRKPGVYGKDYIYPDARIAAPFVASGMKIVRVPILWERIQPVPGEALAVDEMKRLDKALAGMNGFETIILDVHNYGKLGSQRLDQMPEGEARLTDLWQRLADRYKAQSKIAFGLMNEPNGIPADAWRKMVDGTVKAIRGTGARNLILVPGTSWTGAHSWTRSGNAKAFAGFRDPGGNFAFEMHQYLDHDNSGTKEDCVKPTVAADRLRPATQWLRQNKYRGFLGEFGAASNDQCLEALNALLQQVEQGSDVWMGWAYWAGGAWWKRYPMNIQPEGGQQKPQMAVLSRFMGKGR